MAKHIPPPSSALYVFAPEFCEHLGLTDRQIREIGERIGALAASERGQLTYQDQPVEAMYRAQGAARTLTSLSEGALKTLNERIRPGLSNTNDQPTDIGSGY